MGGRRRTEGRQDKKELAEEYCFICKDTGAGLRVCDFENCFKSYHPSCAGNDDGFLSPDEQFICDWHTCVNCRGSSDYQCLCCPLYSVCNACLGHVDFVQLGKRNKGFCSMCLKQAILMEKNADPDPDVEKTNDRDEIDRILFKDYWEITKDREHLTLVDLEEANVFLNRRINSKGRVNSENFPDDENKSDENVLADNDQAIPFDSKCEQNKVNRSLKKKTKNKTFIGWGSEELIEFLSSVGKDTAKPLDEHEIVGVVKGYIKEKNLYQDDKKLCFLCDDRLQPLFTRRKVRCKKIHRFLAVHLASNTEDENSFGSEDGDTPAMNMNKRPRNSLDDDTPVMKKRPCSLEPKIAKRVSERSKRCFASLVHKNINLIYLRRTLVVNLLSHPDTFEQKVVGCFVRIKVSHLLQSYLNSKKAFVLGRVTGIKKASEEYKVNGTYTNILLCVTVPWTDVKISTLSDEDFEEDECNDLISSVKEGLLEKATIAEFEEKLAIVHTDIVNHWIERELVRLEKILTKHRTKGTMQKLDKLLRQKQLLSTPAERQRRLDEVPEIVPETEYKEKETELEVAASNSSQENRGAAQQVPNSLNDLDEELRKGARDQVPDSLNILNEESSQGVTEQIPDPLSLLNNESSEAHEVCLNGVTLDPAQHSELHETQVTSKQGGATCEAPSEAREACLNGVTLDPAQHSQLHETQAREACLNGVTLDPAQHSLLHETQGREGLNGVTHDPAQHSQLNETLDDTPVQGMDDDQEESDHSRQVVMTKFKGVEVINLESDEDEDRPNVQHKPEGKATHAPRAMNGGNLWNYIDPQGVARGPFTLFQLGFWKQNGFFNDDFRVWRTGQTAEQAILLTDAFRLHM